MDEFLNVDINIKTARYEHFKGGIYRVISVAFDARDGQPLVLYESEQDEKFWVRPISEFFENVERENYSGPRFKMIAE